MAGSPSEQDTTQHLTDAQLAALATGAALGLPLGEHDAAHLRQCRACQRAADELAQMVGEAFSGRLVPQATPPPDLSFLRRVVRSATTGERHAASQVVLGMADLIDSSDPVLAFMGASRGDLIGRYTQSLHGPDGPNVIVEVIATDTTRSQGRIRIAVDMPSRDPLDQSGNRVVLRVDGQLWSGETDQHGQVELGPVPVAALPRMRIEIEA